MKMFVKNDSNETIANVIIFLIQTPYRYKKDNNISIMRLINNF